MLPIVVGVLPFALFVAVLVLAPSDHWEMNSELWYEQLPQPAPRDTFAEELAVMRLDAEVPTRFTPRQPRPTPRAGAPAASQG